MSTDEVSSPSRGSAARDQRPTPCRQWRALRGGGAVRTHPSVTVPWRPMPGTRGWPARSLASAQGLRARSTRPHGAQTLPQGSVPDGKASSALSPCRAFTPLHEVTAQAVLSCPP